MTNFTPMALVVCVLTMVLCSQRSSLGVETPENFSVTSVSFGSEFSSGDYNSDSTTRTAYMPLIVSWYSGDRFDVSAEIPFIYQSSSRVTTSLFQGATVTADVQSVARRGGPGGIVTPTGTGTSGGISPVTGDEPVAGGSSSVYGVGDIILRSGYVLLPESDTVPQIRASLFVKVPTASVSDGLGTGEFDFGGGADLSKWFGSMHLFGEALYTYQGSVAGFALKNYVSYSGVVGYQVTDSVQPMLILKGATAPSDYSDNLLEARGRLLWALAPTTTLDLFVAKGISASSPDYGGGAAIIYSF
ncbi:MAG: transporter [Desulfuromonadaceae bacterium]|nr:transporter [Desulfuromonadaceae bacterium]MDD5105754.1 transporter [Desulfuromonadaceae bacterium]